MTTTRVDGERDCDGTAGRRGVDVRSDCWVGIERRAQGGLSIDLQSSVEAYYGDATRELIQRGAARLGIESAHVRIEDKGALPFVLMARFEAAARSAELCGDERWAPEMDPSASYGSRRDALRRSRLYLPGDAPRYMINAGLHRPDAVILDLEDSVAPTAKGAARVLVRNALLQVDFQGCERMVRINPGDEGRADLAEIAECNVHVVLIPKVESAEDVRSVEETLRGLTDRDFYLMPIIESAAGVLNALEIARASDCTVALTIGLEDYTADLGVRRTNSGGESLFARTMVVHAAKACGLQAIDSVFSDVADEKGLRASLVEARSIGFEGKGCIHPRQIRVVHETLAPSPEEVQRACAIVHAFDEARAQGLAVVSLGTKMIDPPVVIRAERTVELAVSSGQLDADWRERGQAPGRNNG